MPLLALSVLEGHAWGGAVQVPFLLDVHAHARFLVALPLFIVAELVVHEQMRPAVRQFIERGLVPEAARPKFDAALASALRLRNSVLAELLLLAFVCLVGVLVIWRTRAALNVTTWYALPADGALHPTLAGWWFMAVSLPLFQFILLRWYFRLFIWTRFLWQVARIDLRLVPTHPDQAGGLGFLSNVVLAFAPLLFGQGALLAGLMAGRIFFEGAKLLQFKIELVAAVGLLLFFLCWGRCWSLCRTWRGPGAPACANTARWPAATCVNSTRNGCAAAPRRTNRCWAVRTCNPSPTWGTASNRVRAMRLVPFGMDALTPPSSDNPAAGAAADPDDDLTGRITQPAAKGPFLTSEARARQAVGCKF